MSVYNGADFLRETISSILSQTFSDFEFIIINDGSTDSTRMILESYTDPRIRLFHQKNIGLTKSLNIGLREARGEYIARQDAEDISVPQRLEYEVNFMNKHPDIGLVGTYGIIIVQKDKYLKSWKLPISHQKINEELLLGNCFIHGSVLFRKECLTTVGNYREEFKYSQDYDYWARIAEKYKVANIDKELYKYRLNAISRKKLTEQLYYHLLIAQLIRNRRKTGADNLDQINLNNIRLELADKFHMSVREINQFKANSYINKSYESLIAKNYLVAFILFVKSIFSDKKLVLKRIVKASRKLHSD